jgi:hypothetical protein
MFRKTQRKPFFQTDLSYLPSLNDPLGVFSLSSLFKGSIPSSMDSSSRSLWIWTSCLWARALPSNAACSARKLRASTIVSSSRLVSFASDTKRLCESYMLFAFALLQSFSFRSRPTLLLKEKLCNRAQDHFQSQRKFLSHTTVSADEVLWNLFLANANASRMKPFAASFALDHEPLRRSIAYTVCFLRSSGVGFSHVIGKFSREASDRFGSIACSSMVGHMESSLSIFT